MQGWSPPQEDHSRFIGAAYRVDPRCAADIAIAQHSLVQVEIVGHGEYRKIAAQEVQEPVLLAKRQSTGCGM